MEKIEIRNLEGHLIDGVLTEVDDDRLYYRVVIDGEQVYYASNEMEAYTVLGGLMQARDEGMLQEVIDELNNK